MADLLQPKEFEVEAQDGSKRVYILSKIPYLACREIITQYPIGAMPKVGDYKLNEAMAKKLLAYVAVKIEDGREIRLTTDALIDNHIPDLLTGGRLEIGMIEYQVGFSVVERASTSLKDFVQSMIASISKTSTPSAEPSLPQEKQPS